jgi:hypothetical protein
MQILLAILDVAETIFAIIGIIAVAISAVFFLTGSFGGRLRINGVEITFGQPSQTAITTGENSSAVNIRH